MSTSWGGPHVYPHVFEAGLATLSDRLGLRVRELPTARMSPAELASDPRARAQDLNAAFGDDSVHAIVASIGGDDSALILAHLDPAVIRANPKVLMGYSDTVTQLVFCHDLGLVTFHGPSVMAGLAQLGSFPGAEAHLRSVLFEPADRLDYEAPPHWSEGYPDWAEPGNAARVERLRPHDGWRWLNGEGVRSGRLFGGCLEVLEVLRGSRHWPGEAFWDGRILFLETSELVPSVAQVRSWLLGYGIQGVFDRISALLVGRARGYTDAEKVALDHAIVDTVVGRFGASELVIVTNLDFGHTDPQWILPLGVKAEVDCERRSFSLVEAAVI